MKVVNYNDDFRKQIKTFDLELKKKENYKDEKYVNLFYRLYINIKKGSPFYDYLLGLVFETAYLVASLSLNYYPDDEELQNSMIYLNSFLSIDELRNRLTLNSFINFLEDVNFFCDTDLYYKRNACENALIDKEYLMDLFPCFLNDVLFYLNSYDASVILDTYYEMIQSGDKDPFNNTVMMNTEDLINLEENDFYSYKYIVLEMIDYYYKYKKYLLSNNLLEDDFDIDIISMIEEDLLSTIGFSTSNMTLLNKIISGYLEYQLLPKEKLEEIEEFYSHENNKKEYVKIINESYKLRNNK